MDLLGAVKRAKEIVGKIPNEESTKLHLILPVLIALGWDVFNPDEVMPETHTNEGRPDYALMINGRTVAFLEAKSVKERIFTSGGINPKHVRQLGRYCFDRGVDVGILTNGLQWALIKAYESGKSIDERVILAVDLMNQSIKEVVERLLWLSKEKITDYQNIPPGYSKIPTQVPLQRIPIQTLPNPRPPTVSSPGNHKFRTLYVSAREIPSLPASAIPVRGLLGANLKGYQPSGVFVKLNGKWYRVEVSHWENWRRHKLAWSSITAVVVRFLCDKGICDFPEMGRLLTKQYPRAHPEWTAKVEDWYVGGPANGKEAVSALNKLEKHLGVEIALKIK
ncbi:MAG: hypothetical protein J7L37_00275 [Thermococcus sp.]|nr:hypothetical protein [Thermococcus sp.]